MDNKVLSHITAEKEYDGSHAYTYVDWLLTDNDTSEYLIDSINEEDRSVLKKIYQSGMYWIEYVDVADEEWMDGHLIIVKIQKARSLWILCMWLSVLKDYIVHCIDYFLGFFRKEYAVYLVYKDEQGDIAASFQQSNNTNIFKALYFFDFPPKRLEEDKKAGKLKILRRCY